MSWTSLPPMAAFMAAIFVMGLASRDGPAASVPASEAEACGTVRRVMQDDDDPASATTLREALLRFARRHDPDVSLGPIRAQLDVYELELQERLDGIRDGRARATAVATYFFQDQKFTASSDLASPDNFYVQNVLTTRQGYCLSLSAIILAVSERLRLPLHGVASPRHFFLRWDDGRVKVNIETTEGGALRDDTYYRARGVTDAAHDAGIYLKNLDSRAVIAYLLNNEGYVHWSKGDPSVAVERFRAAIILHPHLIEARLNLGVAAGERGDEAEAQEHFAQVLRWMPGDAPTVFNRALAALRAGRFSEALEVMDDARARDPKNALLSQYRDTLVAALLRPDRWKAHQDALHATAQGLRKAGDLATGWWATYFPTPDLTGASVSRVDPRIRFEWRWDAPHPRIPADRFSARWEAWIDLPSDGPWTFLTVANDGVRVWVDGLMIIDNWKRNEGALDQETLELQRGLHRVRVEYFDDVRFAGIDVRIKRADQSGEIDADRFFHAARR